MLFGILKMLKNQIFLQKLNVDYDQLYFQISWQEIQLNVMNI